MGLDMYLSKRTYVKNEDYYVMNWKPKAQKLKAQKRHTVTVTGPCESQIRPERITYIEEEVGYWRKANAIHQWFVTQCQDGVDDCRPSIVSRTQLTTLRELCDRLLALRQTDPAAANQAAAVDLPTDAAGLETWCFLGLDESYWAAVQYTTAMVTALLAEDDAADQYPMQGYTHYTYQSSW